MKKMKNRNKETHELIMALRLATACAIEFVAIVIAIPAKIVLGISGVMAKIATKLAGNKSEVVQRSMTDEEVIAEISDV